MKKASLKFVWMTCAILFLAVLQGNAFAEEALKPDLTRHGTVIKSAFVGVVDQAKHLVVEIEINRTKICPGTLVQYQAKDQTGLVVCKASLLGEHASRQDQFRCHGAEGVWLSALFIGYDKELDMSFLRIEFPSVAEQKKIHHATETWPGQWLVSLGYRKKLPIGIGVLGAEPRVIDSSQGFVGLSVDETDQGLSVSKVMANSGAAHAGLLTGDRLMESEEKLATNRRWFSRLLRQYEPGDWLPLLAKRGEEVIQLDLQIGTSWDNILDRQVMMNRFGSDVSERRTGFRSVIQHDTIVHPRYCGGPLVNLKGEIVGVNIARAGRTDTFAVPITEILESAKKFDHD